jgi:hypothetical protein
MALLQQRRVQKPSSFLDFIFSNRSARSNLLVGSWVHFDVEHFGELFFKMMHNDVAGSQTCTNLPIRQRKPAAERRR